MNPLKLTLQNFLCYRENVPTLDFTGLHLACLSGANGHGKSALLDAITWSLWGEARSRTQDELISYGADEMRVELEFLARDIRYRVIRSHARGGGRRRQGVTDLQLQVAASGQPSAISSPSTGEGRGRIADKLTTDSLVWQPITGNSVRETQAKIEQVLGLDYDTFINSAFLLQGRADEFTNKTAAERKVVLGKVLGLSAYDRLQDHAKERLAAQRESADRLGGAVEAMSRQVEALGDPSPELAGVGLRREALAEQLQRQSQGAEALRSRVGELQRQRDDLAALQKRMQSLRQDLALGEAGLRNAQQRVGEYQAIIQQAEAIQRGAAQLQEARRSYQTLEQSRVGFEALRREQESLERLMDTRRARLEERLRQLRQQESELAAQAQETPALATLLDVARRQLAALEPEEQAVVGQRERLQRLAGGIGEARTTSERFRVEGLELKAKLEFIDRTGHAEAVCPLCQASLGADGCQRLAQVYQGEIADKRRLYRDNQASLQRLESEKTAAQDELRRREQALERSRQESQRKVGDLERRLEQAGLAQEGRAQVAEQLAAAQAMLESGEFAALESRQREDLAVQMAALGYDEEARQLSYRQTQELQAFEDRQRRLAQAVAGLPQEEEALAGAQDMLSRRREELAGQESQLRAGQAALAELPQGEARLRQAEQALREAVASQQTAQAREALLKDQQRRLEVLRQESAEASEHLKALQEEQAVYRELVTAFGRQGVQAMLIETVVPRLEQEANLLLGRMTDNRMHLQLKTQRERRTASRGGQDDLIETLEILVQDELGPRAYEMYSGGEAFRVNLALRIALSRVLSQRMGAPLPTLFIDEGFGTQDAAGRERIVDVISTIRDEFDKIIVITHLDDLKDQFPDRIEVWKEPSGSTFRLS